MAMRDLIPWSRGRDMAVRRGEDSPFLTLHREMNRLSTIFSAVLISHHSVRIASSIELRQLARR